MSRRRLLWLSVLALLALALAGIYAATGSAAAGASSARTMTGPMISSQSTALQMMKMETTNADRVAASQHAAKDRAAAVATSKTSGGVKVFSSPLGAALAAAAPAMNPGGVPDYFSMTPNWALSQLPTSVSIVGDGLSATATATIGTAGAITGFTITNSGLGYTTATVTVVGGGGSGATGAATFDPVTGAITGMTVSSPGSGYGTLPGIRKFVDTLPGLGPTGINDLGQYIPVAVPDTTTFPGSDYYEIALVQYKTKMHADVPATTLQGYVQISTTAVPGKHVALTYLNGSPILDRGGNPVYAVDSPQYLGPTIVAQRNTPVRVKFTNYLPTNAGGNLFLPVDTTDMGAGDGNNQAMATAASVVTGSTVALTTAAMPTKLVVGQKVDLSGFVPASYNGTATVSAVTSTTNFQVTLATAPTGAVTTMGMVAEMYTQNRATLHLHGGATPWISDGTPHQWTSPSGENTNYPKGVSVRDVPDMGASGTGDLTFYYTNQESARLLFYHDHAYGITRLNVYSGEAAGYLVQDSAESTLTAGGVISGGANQIPLVIQDKTFVPSPAQLAAEDPTWDTTQYGGYGNLWLPHVYMPNQNPWDPTGANMMGRWDYGPWFWPPNTGITNGQKPNPLFGLPGEPPYIPGTPNPTIVPEAFTDTPLVNGTAYPYLNVNPTKYRFRILNAANDRTWNLSLYVAKGNGAVWSGSSLLANGDAGEVPMVPASPSAALPFPSDWTTATGGAGIRPDILDGRVMGVPDPRNLGPSWVQIGTEGGFLPHPVTLDPKPTGYEYNLRNIVVLNISKHSLLLGPAERADVVVDFSKYAGKTLILYNDGPAPVPAGDPRNDYYTNDPDQTSTGGAPTTQPGYGPNTRTIMQIRVAAAPVTDSAPNVSQLPTALPAAYAASQPAPVIGQTPYNGLFGATYATDPSVRIQDTSTSSFIGAVTGLQLTNAGSGYSAAPTVGFTPADGNGTGATATATMKVSGFNLTSGGLYTAAPTVALSGGGGSGATATAALKPTSVGSVAVTNPGSGFTTAPTVGFSGGGGAGTAASATLTVSSVRVTAGGKGYRTAPTVTFAAPPSGTRATGTATITNKGGGVVTGVTITNPGTGYTSAPAITFSGGGGTGAAATATMSVQAVTVTNGGTGFTSAPTVTLTGGGGTGALATATLTPTPVASLTVTNPGSGYATAPAVSFSTTTGTGAVATATLSVDKLTLTNGGTGYTAAPTVTFTGGGGTGAAATAYHSLSLRPKAIQELFDPDYGRMNALLGVEIPNSTGVNQTTIPFYNPDPPTEVINTNAGPSAPTIQPIESLPDGTQIWKITHNGVDTHTLHWHMFNVQVINRVGWDGAIRLPEPNEYGWKESVRMNPLEDIIIAVKPIVPNVPWPLPNSIRPLDVTSPLGSTTAFSGIDTQNNPVAVTNTLVNFGWEYVWHCHLLGHEENDMMRPMAVGVAPLAPGAPTAVKAGTGIALSFVDNSVNETGFQIQRATSASGPWTTVGTVNRAAPVLNANGSVTDYGLSRGTTVTYTDPTPVTGATNYYRVLAVDLIGYTQTFAAPAVGFPTETVPSAPSGTSAGVAM